MMEASLECCIAGVPGAAPWPFPEELEAELNVDEKGARWERPKEQPSKDTPPVDYGTVL